MIRLIRVLRKLLNKYILNSFLKHTSPATRFFVALVMCGALFYKNPIALGMFTALLFLIAFAEPGALKRNWLLFLFPVIAGLIMAATLLIPGFAKLKTIVSMGLLIWKLFILVLAAVVFDVLVPQKDFRKIVRTFPSPHLWVATIAAIRSAEIGAWAISTVAKTIRTRSIYLTQTPKLWIDAVITSIIGHYAEFLNGFSVSLRSRGVESPTYVSHIDIPKFDHVDILVLLVIILGFILFLSF